MKTHTSPQFWRNILLGFVLLLPPSTSCLLAQAPATAAPPSGVRLVGIVARATPAENEDKRSDVDVDFAHFKEIYKAIQAYRAKNGDLPGWLSDLYPIYLQDTNLLMCPEELRSGKSDLMGYGDVRIKSSYIYEFNDSQAGGVRDRDIPLTMKQWKSLQMEEFGPVIPVLRCHLHDPVANMSYSGETYTSQLYWETDPNALALMKKLGPGPGAKNGRKMRLKVLNASDGQPVPAAEVLATNRVSELGPLPPRQFSTGADGTCELNLGGKTPRSLILEVGKPGFATVSTTWSTTESIPEEWTVRLDRSATIGGVVLDRAGKPVAGVSVLVNGTIKDEVGQVVPAKYDLRTTDSEGKWQSTRVPAGFNELSFNLAHPEFMPAEYDLVTGDTPGPTEVTRQSLLDRTAKMTLTPGIKVQGTVADGGNKPAPNATVQLVCTDEEQRWTTRTKADENGRFRLTVTRLGNAALMVEAEGLAPAEFPIDLKPDLQDLAIHLDKGRLLAGKVVDSTSTPLADVSVNASWQGVGSISWRTRTDAQGHFSWDSAPVTNIALGFSKQGYVTGWHQPPQGSPNEWVIQLQTPFRLSGKVLDAVTGEPVKKFKLRSGYAYSVDDVYRWEPRDLPNPGDGTYSISSEESSFAGSGRSLKYAVWADGYLPATTPVLKPAGDQTFDFKLKPGKGLSGIIQLPNGDPVSGAVLFLTTRSSGVYMDKPGEFRRGIFQSQEATSDDQGRFQFQPELEPQSVVVAHEKGYAELPVDKIQAGDKLILEPWATVKGSVKMKQAGPNQSLAIHNVFYRRFAAGPSAFYPSLSLYLNTKQEEGGTFIFEKVPPGPRKLYLQYRFQEGPGPIPLSHGIFLDLKPGEVREVNLGEHGRTIIGKVDPIGEKASEVNWTRDLHRLTSKPPQDEPTYPRISAGLSQEERAKAMDEYRQKSSEYWNSEQGLRRQQQQTDYILLFEENGSFRVEGVPPGEYVLTIAPTGDPGATAGMPVRYGFGGPTLGTIRKDISVPPGNDDSPIDLGTLELRVTTPRRDQQSSVILR